jgi:hypothetical protein
MESIIKDYGRVVLLVILISGCLTMFVNFWYGENSLAAIVMNGAMRASTDSMTVINTGDEKFIITSENGNQYTEVQLGTSVKLEEIAERDITLYGAGEQNKSGYDGNNWNKNQLVIGVDYNTTDLFYAIDSDGVEIRRVLDSDTGTDSNNYFDEVGYYRPLSISTASGYELISDLSVLKKTSIGEAIRDESKITKTDGVKTTFSIKNQNDEALFTYNVKTQKWKFSKAGIYCLKVFVCDSNGKSTTGTVYISVNKRITDNIGDGNNTTGH